LNPRNGSENTRNGQANTTKGNRLQFHGDRHFTYDARGNLTEERRGTGGRLQTKYTYNSQNQLIKVEKDGQTFEYAYDPLGRRIRKKDAFGETEFLWNGDVLLSEKRNHAEKLYLYEPNSFKPLAFIENNQCYFYHLDHLGTPQELTNWKGQIVWSARYRVYGNVVRQDVEAVQNNLRFQGQYWDEETGLHYNRFRYYDPGTGQFTQQDPIGLDGGLNNYQYAPNPTGWIDPNGLSCKENPWNVFQQRSKGVFKDSKQAAQGYKHWKNGEWAELEALLGPGSWPPNRGAISPKAETLQPGHRIDRFGGWHDSSGDFRDMGSFVSPEGEKFDKRALPMATKNKPYMSYEVLKPLDVESAEAIPWFGMQGKGTQYELSDSIEKLGML